MLPGRALGVALKVVLVGLMMVMELVVILMFSDKRKCGSVTTSVFFSAKLSGWVYSRWLSTWLSIAKIQ